MEASHRMDSADVNPAQLCARIQELPRYPLAHRPTPLEPLPRFSAAVGGPSISIKRDDCTGLVFGGNKARHNEFILAEAQRQGADLFVWGGGVQSNNCRQTAAACAKAGIDCHLVLTRGKPGDEPIPLQGNLLLDHLVGASYEFVDVAFGEALERRIAEVAERFQSQGRKVFRWNRHVVTPLAAVSYVECLAEIVEQSHCARFRPRRDLRFIGRLDRRGPDPRLRGRWVTTSPCETSPTSIGNGTRGPTWPISPTRRPQCLVCRRGCRPGTSM